MADINKFTTKEVLNKVLLDSSGDAVVGFSHTTQEALNAVLDTSNNRLNISIAGGTISGDVTISGDLTVSGDSVANVSETITGSMEVTGTARSSFTKTSSATNSTSGALALKHQTDGNMIDNFGASLDFQTRDSAGSDNTIAKVAGVRDGADNQGALTFQTAASGGTNTERMRITTTGDVTIAANAEFQEAAQGDSGNRIKLKNSSSGDMEFNLENAAYSFLFSGDVQITSASAGGSSAIYDRANELVIENNDHAGITIKSPADKETSVFFGDADDSSRSGIRYNHDGDTMTFQVASSKLILDLNSRISLSNNDSGTSNTIFGKSAGANLDAGSNYNVFVGENVSDASMDDASYNVGVGYSALSALTQGDSNTALGYNSLLAVTTGSSNTALGRDTLRTATNGASNVAIGQTSMYSLTSGGNNVGVGNGSLYSNETGQFNTAVGISALSGASGQSNSNNTAVGYYSLKAITTGGDNVAVGSQAGDSVTSGAQNTFLGKQAGQAVTTQSNNTFLGFNSGLNQSGTANVAVGNHTMKNAVGDTNYSTAVGSGALYAVSTGDANTAIGTDALGAVNSGENNTALGAYAGDAITTGSNNIALGYKALTTATTAYSNVVIGKDAMEQVPAGQAVNSCVAIGLASLKGSSSTTTGIDGTVAIGLSSLQSLTSGARNTMIGNESGTNITTSADNTAIGYNAMHGNDSTATTGTGRNTAIGSSSLSAITTGQQNVTIGTSTGATMTTSSNNVLIGHNSGTAINAGQTTTDGTVAIGSLALTALTTGGSNVAIGHNAAAELEDNHANTVIGYQAMYRSGTTTYHNVYIGNLAGDGDWTGACHSNTAVGSSVMRGAMTATAINNVAMGRDTLAALTSGHSNVALGKSAGDSITTMSETTLVGFNAGSALSTGTGQNVAIGSEALSTATSVQFTTAVGYKALQGISAAAADDNQTTGIGWAAGYNITTGLRNTAIGAQALLDNQTGNNNTAVGQLALENTTGAESVGVGKGAGQTNTSGINNTFVGTDADSSGNFNYQTAVGWGAVTDGSYGVAIGMNGIIKYKTARVTVTKAHGDDQSIIAEVCKIPAESIIFRVTCTVVTKSTNLNPYVLNLCLSTSSGTAADGALANASSTITAPELLGYGASGGATYQQQSNTAIGNRSNINAGTGATEKRVYTNQPLDTIVGTADTFLYVVNGDTGNGTTDSSPVVLDICVEYQGMD